VVVCSRLSEPTRRQAFGWVVLYPDHENRAIIDIAGQEATVEDPDLDALLAALDRAARRRRVLVRAGALKHVVISPACLNTQIRRCSWKTRSDVHALLMVTSLG
jgi:hypothetical protein